jgi:hypothetical protein
MVLALCDAQGWLKHPQRDPTSHTVVRIHEDCVAKDGRGIATYHLLKKGTDLEALHL